MKDKQLLVVLVNVNNVRLQEEDNILCKFLIKVLTECKHVQFLMTSDRRIGKVGKVGTFDEIVHQTKELTDK